MSATTTTSAGTGADGARHRQIAYALATGSVAVTVVAFGFMIANGQSLVGSFNFDLLIVGTVYAVVGGLLWARIPGNPIGPIFLAAGWSFGLTFLLDEYAVYGAVTSPASSLPAVGLAAWIGQWLWIPGNALMLCGIPLLFPDGHLPSRRWRPIAALVLVGVIFDVATAAIALLPLLTHPADATLTDPSTVPGLLGWLASIGQITLFLVAPIVSLSAVVIRYRRSRGVVRQQMRWLTVALVFLAATVIGDELAGLVIPNAPVGLVSVFGLALLPVALGIAILRYRLYEIDRIISRTVGYAIVSLVLVGVFGGVVLLLTAVLAPLTGGNTLAVAGSTLAVAALFQPLRRRVQRGVDRRFHRSRYDADRALEAFAGRLRDQVDLGELQAEVIRAAGDAIHPTTSALWLRGADR